MEDCKPNPRLLTTEQAADFLGLTPEEMALCKSGYPLFSPRILTLERTNQKGN